MSTPRGHANHALYLARVLLQAWERERQAENLPASLLAQAFGPAAREHLLNAYGWCLLHLQQPAQQPPQLPHCVADLPPTAPGKAQPAEIDEFARLEVEGWLTVLLREPGLEPVRRSVGNLAASASGLPDAEALQQVANHLEAAFSRVGDALDEC